MLFLSHYWWAFLIVTVIAYGAIFANQILRMKRLASGSWIEPAIGKSAESLFASFFKGFGLLIFFGAIGTLSGILFLIGVILAIIQASR